MLRYTYIIITFHTFMWIIYGFNYKQNGAVMKCDPDYFANCTALTRRIKRGEPYKTNITFTLLSPFYNNCTFHLYFRQKGQPEIDIFKIKTCDAMKHPWIVDYFHKFTNIREACPMNPGTYYFQNMELPPKNFPIPLPPGNLDARVAMIPTSVDKMIFEVSVKLNI